MSFTKFKGLHHTGFRCRDAEETRAFYEDFLGLPLVRVVTLERIRGLDMTAKSLQLTFGLPNGSFLTFVDSPETARPDQFAPTDGVERHIALEADSLETLFDIKEALAEHEIPCAGPVDHGVVQSLYFWDPNGLQVELAVPNPDEVGQTGGEEDMRRRIAEWSRETEARKAWLFPVRA